MATKFIGSFIAASALFFGATPVSAQTGQEFRPERPYRGMYASGTDDAQQVLTITGGVGAGYDTNVLANQTDAGLVGGEQAPLTAGGGSSFGSLSGGLSYAAAFDSVAIGASLSSSGRYYPNQSRSFTSSHAASGGINLDLGRRTKVGGSGSVGYQPFRAFLPFPGVFDQALGQIMAPDQAYYSGQSDYYTYATAVSLSQQLGRRASLEVSFDRYSTVGENDNRFGMERQTGSIRFTRSLTRRLGLRLGYGYTDANYDFDRRDYQNHNLDTGVDYSRDFSLTRRTKLAFSTGGTAVTQSGDTRYDVSGHASVTREIGRTWSAVVNYQRSVGFIDSLREPAFSNGVSAGLQGLISRRFSFHSSLAATVGRIGVTSAARRVGGFDAWTGTAGVGTALTRHLSLGVNYNYYRYAFDSTALLANNLLPGVGRHSVVVSLNAWAPVFQHGRKSNASR